VRKKELDFLETGIPLTYLRISIEKYSSSFKKKSCGRVPKQIFCQSVESAGSSVDTSFAE
jgi:hypothetical protein